MFKKQYFLKLLSQLCKGMFPFSNSLLTAGENLLSKDFFLSVNFLNGSRYPLTI